MKRKQNCGTEPAEITILLIFRVRGDVENHYFLLIFLYSFVLFDDFYWLRNTILVDLVKGCPKFFSEGQMQKNMQRARSHTRGDISTHGYCVVTTWLITRGLNITVFLDKLKLCNPALSPGTLCV